MYNLKDKVGIVTGGANGIGAGIVNEFLKEGAKFVAILDVDEVTGIEFQTKLVTKYGKDKIKFFKCNVTKDEQLFGVFDELNKNFGNIDVVVNNAGIADETGNKYKTLIEINFTAVVTSSLKALEMMRIDNGGKGGTIINISSIGCLSPNISVFHVYSGTKSAVLQFSNRIGMKHFYEKTKVRVMAMCFGCTETAMPNNAFSFDERINKEMEVDKEKTSGCFVMQTAEDAAKGVVHSYNVGESGSTWLIDNKITLDISDRMNKAYEIMAEGITFK